MLSWISCLHDNRAVTRTGTCTMLLKERRVSSKRTLSFSREENPKRDVRCWSRLCVCVCVCVFPCMDVLCACMCEGQKPQDSRCPPRSISTLFSEASSSLYLGLTDCWARWPPGLQVTLSCLDIYMRARDQNLGPHTCPASALTAKPSPSPLVVFYIVTYFIHSVLTTAIICLKTNNTFHI